MPADSGNDQSALASAEPGLDIWLSPETVARAAVEQHLAERAQSAKWGRLTRALRTLLGGTNEPGLLDGIGAIDAAITTRALAALRGDIEVPTLFRLAMPFTGLSGRMVNAGWGDRATVGQLAQACVRMGALFHLAPASEPS
jgi:hypothetical protein